MYRIYSASRTRVKKLKVLNRSTIICDHLPGRLHSVCKRAGAGTRSGTASCPGAPPHAAPLSWRRTCRPVPGSAVRPPGWAGASAPGWPWQTALFWPAPHSSGESLAYWHGPAGPSQVTLCAGKTPKTPDQLWEKQHNNEINLNISFSRDMKRCICHFTKRQIHPFISEWRYIGLYK